MNIKNFISKLPQTYWSEHPPKKYTIFHDGRIRGIGLIAGKDFGAWNLIHDKYDWNTWVAHEEGVMAWAINHQALKMEFAGATLSDTVVALGPKQWAIWWKANRSKVPVQSRARIDSAMVMAKISSH